MLYFLGDTWVELLREVYKTMWLWFPPLTLIALYVQFYSWRQLWWRIEKDKHIFFEIKLPKEITRSPKAMEMVLTSLHITTEGLTYNKWWEGSVRTVASLEIASFGGDIHFYIRINAKWKFLLQSQIYAHYPDVELMEVEDYTAKIPYGLPGSDWLCWGGVYEFGNKTITSDTKEAIPAEGLPLLTYVDYGLDKDPKEEFKVDPMVPLLEYFGNAASNEQLWVQFVIRAAKPKEWNENAIKLRDHFAKRLAPSETVINFAKQSPTMGERTLVEGIERKMSKLAFFTGIRLIYMSSQGKFRPENCLASLGIFRPLNSEGGQKIDFAASTTYDQPWEDVLGIRAPNKREAFWNEYRMRGWHYPPFKRKPMIMTVEELATIFHFPGSVASTPNLQRIGSKKKEAPINLPI